MIVVDDHVLIAVLAGGAAATMPAWTEDDDVFTTGSWYCRLARAVHDRVFAGALSRRLAALPPDVRRLVVQSLDELPPEIGVVSPRQLVPVMASLSGLGRFNHLQAEALATALVLPAGLRVTVTSDAFRAACTSLDIELVVAPI